MELLLVSFEASVSEFSVVVGYDPGDDPFHGWSVLVVVGYGFGVFESVSGFGQEPVVWADEEVASFVAGGAAVSEGTGGARFTGSWEMRGE